MIRYLVSIHLFLIVGCGAPNNNTKFIIGEEEPNTTSSTPIIITEPEIVEPLIPEGAAVGDFRGDSKSFYAEVSRVDTKNEITYISFENNILPTLAIPKSFGGTVSSIAIDGFNSELLLLTAKLKDPNFNKYYLFVHKNNNWLPVMNGFAIHKNNLTNNLEPFIINPNNPNEFLRRYSVFNLDASSALGYSWLLLEESVPIENR